MRTLPQPCPFPRARAPANLGTPTIVVSGFMSDTHTVARTPDVKLELFSDFWEPVFTKPQTNIKEIDTFVAKHVKPWDLSELLAPPGEHDFENLLLHVVDCGVGPDCLAYSAWNCAGGPRSLFLLSRELMQGHAGPWL